MADMTDTAPQTEWLGKQLRQTEPQLDDARFTAAVMTGLPQKRGLPVWQKNAILLAATACGSGLVAAQIARPVVTELLIGAATNLSLLVVSAAVITYAASAAAVWFGRMA